MKLRRLLPTLAVALAALPSVAAAQDWSGANGFRILVTDDAGQPVPEVTVIARLAEADRSGGPPPMLTDEAGTLDVSDLAAGEWEIQLRRQGFMIVNSYLRLEDGKRPQVGFTSRQRTGPFWAPLNVGYSSLGVATAAASAGSARATTRAQRRAERRAEQRERRLRQENVARVVEAPKAEAPAPETPASPVEKPAATETVAASAQRGEEHPPPPEPPPPEPPSPEPSSPEPSSREPVVVAEQTVPDRAPAGRAEPPAPQPEAEPEPEPEPLPEPEPAPVVVRLLPNPTLLRAGACPECAPGEWSVSSNWPAEPRTAGTTACAADLAGRLERAAGMIEGSLQEEFRVYIGALASPEGNDVLRLLPEATRTEVRALLVPVLDPERSCQVIGVLLPKDVRFVGFQYEAADLSARGGCFPDQPCEIGEAQWRGNPVLHRHDHGTLVYGVFENLSPDDRREANLKVYFRPPRGWLPPR